MKLKSTIVIITLMAVVALVGVGYATWTFNTVATDTVNTTGAATAAIDANGLLVKNAEGTADVTTLYIICDAPSSHGIYWSTTNDSTAWDHHITQLKLVGSVAEDDNDILDFSTYTGTFTCTYAGDDTLDWIIIPAISLNQDVVSASANADVTYNFTLPTLTYRDVPESIAEVNLLETEVSTISFTLTFNFTVKSVA